MSNKGSVHAMFCSSAGAVRVSLLSSAMYFHEMCKDVLFCASHPLSVWLKLALKLVKTALKPTQEC